jgi:hypothetical protein
MTSDDDDDRQFTPAERKAIRKMIEQDERVAWLWSSARVWAGWVSAGIITGFALLKAAQEWFPHFFKKVGGP